MVNELPKRMRFKDGNYYFVAFAGGWKPLGRDFTNALVNYLQLYGNSCSPEIRDIVTELYLAALKR